MEPMTAARDQTADAYELAEMRLTQWGLACRRESDRLGLPRISGIQQLIDHVRREDAKSRSGRKQRVRKDRARGEPVYIRTAQGTETQVARRAAPVINSAALEVDAIVARLPGWMQAPIIRRYLYGQPDRLACRDLKLPKEDYRLRCKAAVEYVAESLVRKQAVR